MRPYCGTHGVKRNQHAYDCWCQYRKHRDVRLERIIKDFPELETVQVKYFPWTLGGIGKFHAPAHTAACRSKFSFHFMPGVGMTDGEAPERIWAIPNSLALRTKEMSSGHRHDVISDFHNDMNCRRLHGMRESNQQRRTTDY